MAQATGRDKGSPSDASGNGALRLDRATGVPLLLTIAPLGAETAWNGSPRPAAIILIAMPDDLVATAPGHLRTLFGLTPTESAVAVRIAQGQGVAAAAESLRVSPSTLRWHLQRVFEKTGTTRQAELARLVPDDLKPPLQFYFLCRRKAHNDTSPCCSSASRTMKTRMPRIICGCWI